MPTPKTKVPPRVVQIEGREVTLIPERKPEPDWQTRPGGWELLLDDGRVVGWVLIDVFLRGPSWQYIVHDPARLEREKQAREERQKAKRRRPLAETPWSEMDQDQKRLAIDLGIVRLVEPAPPPPRPPSPRALEEQARVRALFEFDRNPAHGAWFDQNAAEFEDSFAERREAAEYYARRTGMPFVEPPRSARFPRERRNRR